MNGLRTFTMIAASLAIALPQGAISAPAPNAKLLSGTWHLNLAKSKFSSTEFTPKSETRTYSVSGSRITMRSSSVLPSGKPLKWNYTAATNGLWFPTSGNPNTDRISITLVSDREFKSQTKLRGNPAARSTVTVSADGKALMMKRSILTAKGGPTDDTLVYERVK